MSVNSVSYFETYYLRHHWVWVLKNEKRLFVFSEHTWGKELIVLTIDVLRAIQEMENNSRCSWQMRPTVFIFFWWTYWFCFKILPCIDFPLHQICVLSTILCRYVRQVENKRFLCMRLHHALQSTGGTCGAISNSKLVFWHLYRAFTI